MGAKAAGDSSAAKSIDEMQVLLGESAFSNCVDDEKRSLDSPEALGRIFSEAAALGITTDRAQVKHCDVPH